jgi:beta-galactosidase GanA
MIKRLLFFAALAVVTAIPLFAQDDDIDAQIKKAMENPNQPAPKNPKMKQLEKQAMEDITNAEAEEKAEAAKQKAAAQAVVDVKGPVSLPEWTPQVPQFTPSGPPARKLVDGEPKIILTGTSPLPPAALADAWDKFSNPKFSHERTGSEINHSVDLFVSFRNSEDNTEVKLEVERKAGAKLTHVTISSPLKVPATATDSN